MKNKPKNKLKIASFFFALSFAGAVSVGVGVGNGISTPASVSPTAYRAYAEELEEADGEQTNGNGDILNDNEELGEIPAEDTASDTSEIGGITEGEETPDTDTEIVEQGEPAEPTEQTEDENAILNAVIARLKAKYGAEYEEVYNGILEQYGSFKAYVESLIADGKLDLTEEQADGWRDFIKTMDETSVFWVAIIAAVLVVVFAVLAKFGLTKVKELFGKMFKGSNQNSEAIGALVENALVLNNAIAKLLGEGEKTKDLREALAKSNEALENEKEELKKDV